MELKKINFPEESFSEQRLCDGCTRKIEVGQHAVVYFCSILWKGYTRHELPEIIPQEIYCLDCYPNEIPLPHLGNNEGFTYCIITKKGGDYAYNQKGIIKGSPKSEGIEWDPIQILDELHPMPIDDFPYTISPVYVFILFRKSGIDLRGFILNGELQIPQNAKEHVRQMISLTQKRMHKGSYLPEDL